MVASVWAQYWLTRCCCAWMTNRPIGAKDASNGGADVGRKVMLGGIRFGIALNEGSRVEDRVFGAVRAETGRCCKLGWRMASCRRLDAEWQMEPPGRWRSLVDRCRRGRGSWAESARVNSRLCAARGRAFTTSWEGAGREDAGRNRRRWSVGHDGGRCGIGVYWAHNLLQWMDLTAGP